MDMKGDGLKKKMLYFAKNLYYNEGDKNVIYENAKAK